MINIIRRSEVTCLADFARLLSGYTPYRDVVSEEDGTDYNQELPCVIDDSIKMVRSRTLQDHFYEVHLEDIFTVQIIDGCYHLKRWIDMQQFYPALFFQSKLIELFNSNNFKDYSDGEVELFLYYALKNVMQRQRYLDSCFFDIRSKRYDVLCRLFFHLADVKHINWPHTNFYRGVIDIQYVAVQKDYRLISLFYRYKHEIKDFYIVAARAYCTFIEQNKECHFLPISERGVDILEDSVSSVELITTTGECKMLPLPANRKNIVMVTAKGEQVSSVLLQKMKVKDVFPWLSKTHVEGRVALYYRVGGTLYVKMEQLETIEEAYRFIKKEDKWFLDIALQLHQNNREVVMSILEMEPSLFNFVKKQDAEMCELVYNRRNYNLKCTYTSTNEENCPICYEQGAGLWVQLRDCPCKQWYHLNCLKRWLNQCVKCPTCNACPETKHLLFK